MAVMFILLGLFFAVLFLKYAPPIHCGMRLGRHASANGATHSLRCRPRAQLREHGQQRAAKRGKGTVVRDPGLGTTSGRLAVRVPLGWSVRMTLAVRASPACFRMCEGGPPAAEHCSNSNRQTRRRQTRRAYAKTYSEGATGGLCIVAVLYSIVAVLYIKIFRDAHGLCHTITRTQWAQAAVHPGCSVLRRLDHALTRQRGRAATWPAARPGAPRAGSSRR